MSKLKRLGLVGYVLVMVVGFFGFFGSDADAVRPGYESMAPSTEAWLGTDHLGRDVFHRTLRATKNSLGVGLLATLIASVLGLWLGAACALGGKVFDRTLQGCASTFTAVPGIMLVVVLGWLMGPGLWGSALAIGLASWVGTYRLARTESLRLRTLPSFEAAQLVGVKRPRLLRRHILPHLQPLGMTQAWLLFPSAVHTEVILSFLGLGPKDGPSWGTIIAHGGYDLANGVWWPMASATAALAGILLLWPQPKKTPR
ncbi:MAG: ABC transporter permease [Planctomycetes bacterium]|nr:ABC transporter permease [Planctomycetota bacterium]